MVQMSPQNQSATQSPLLRLQGVEKVFPSGDGTVCVLDGVSFELERGEFVAVCGPSGAGKSSLLHVAAGLESPSAGVVEIDGRDFSTLSARDAARYRRNHLGFVFQFFSLIPALSVRDNVALSCLLQGQSRSEAGQAADRLIESVGLTRQASQMASVLSGGEMQRVAVARAIATSPTIVFADEPTGNLDSRNGEVVLDLLARECAQHSTALLMVTHDESAAARADRVVHLIDGKLAGENPSGAHTDTTARLGSPE